MICPVVRPLSRNTDPGRSPGSGAGSAVLAIGLRDVSPSCTMRPAVSFRAQSVRPTVVLPHPTRRRGPGSRRRGSRTTSSHRAKRLARPGTPRLTSNHVLGPSPRGAASKAASGRAGRAASADERPMRCGLLRELARAEARSEVPVRFPRARQRSLAGFLLRWTAARSAAAPAQASLAEAPRWSRARAAGRSSLQRARHDGVGMQRLATVPRSLLGEARRVHDVHAVNSARRYQVVRDHHHRDAELARAPSSSEGSAPEWSRRARWSARR